MVGCLIAGSRATKKNGATAVIPGSHLWPHDRIPQLEECTYAEMEPGSALFTLGSTYHGAGENKCTVEDPEALRTLFAVFAQRDYFRQDQEEILSTPIEIARKLPEDILRLTGYCESRSWRTSVGADRKIRLLEEWGTWKTTRVRSSSCIKSQVWVDLYPE
jgi:ectoine hydroxylase-related dioxygenase (phytanoyl-CoA dioxygenase family)